MLIMRTGHIPEIVIKLFSVATAFTFNWIDWIRLVNSLFLQENISIDMETI